MDSLRLYGLATTGGVARLGCAGLDALADAVAAHDVLFQVQTDAIDLVDVDPCRADEFVCRSCFLVRKRVQLVDASTMACHDCSS